MRKFRFCVVLDVENFDEPTNVIEMVESIEGEISFDEMEKIVDNYIGSKDLVGIPEGLYGTIIIDDDNHTSIELDLMIEYMKFKYGITE
jgi:hypothetical protein